MGRDDVELEHVEVLATGLDHPEGVAWDPDGAVIAGGEAGQLYTITLGGDVTQRGTTAGFLFGVAVDGTGDVLACDFGRACLARVTRDGEMTTVSTGTDERSMAVPNMVVVDDRGGLFVTDSGQWGEDDGVIYRVDDAGTTIWSADVPAFPNGACLTAAGDALLVVESRARRVVQVPIGADGAAGSPTVVADLTGSQPDGIALAADGTMFVGCYRPDRVYRIDPGGAPEVFLDDPDGVVLNQPANVAFIGSGLDRLAISSLGGWSISVVDAGTTGLALRTPGRP
jgi:gluconolactonase